MAWVNHIDIRMPPNDCQSFKDFQDLNPLVREALVIFIETCDEDVALEHLIEPDYIGKPTELLTAILQKQLRDFMWDGRNALSMARCWNDCGRDMIRTKLTWSENY
jgi:hypothetical protein